MNASIEKTDSFLSRPSPVAIDTWAMRDRDERFRLLVENSRDIIVELSPDVEVLYVSPNVTAILGYSSKELIGTNLFEKVHPDDLANVRVQFEQRSGRATCRHMHGDGSWRWLESTGREFMTAGGKLHRVVVARDVTEQKEAAAERERLKTELARAEKFTALGALAGGMAHDFNNILTGIIGHAGFLQLHDLAPDARDSLEQILKAANRAKRITRQVLDYGCEQQRSRAPMRLSAVANEVLRLLKPTIPANIEVVAELPDDGAMVFASATQIHQVLVNLCLNAVHAMRESGGRLAVRVTRVEVDAALARECSGLACGQHICLEVIDNGHGMDPDTRSHIFDPFFTTKREGDGTGLGLAVVQRVVLYHGGVIQVASSPGKGTTFSILLPAHRGGSGTTPFTGSGAGI